MNINFKLNVDRTHIDNALKVLHGHIAKGRALDNEEKAVKDHFAYIGQSLATQSARDKLEEIQQKRAALAYESRAAFNEFLEAYEDNYHELENPNGEHIDKNILSLIEHDMYILPYQLEYVQKKHADNLTMLRLIENYAKKKEWPGFEVQVDSSQYRHALAGIQHLRDGVLYNHNGYDADFVTKYDTADKLIAYYNERNNENAG